MKQLAVPSLVFKGYYEIPNFSRYVVNRNGDVIDKNEMTMKYGAANPAGYFNYLLFRDSDGRRTCVGRHRLLGIVFIHPGVDITNLVVNHINGIKGDDRLGNLEWLTHKENVEHAGALGISPKCLPVSVRNSYTGEIIHFPSIVECARYYGVSKDEINYRTKIGECRVFPEGRQYRLKSDKPWFIPDCLETEIRRNRDLKGVLVRYVFYDLIKEYSSARNFCSDIKMSAGLVSRWLSLSDQPILPGLMQVKWAYDDTPWRRMEDPLAEYNERSKFSKIVQIEDDETKQRHYFLNALSCSRHMGVSPTALDYRLKTEGKSVFSDGCRYMYYTASPSGQKWSDGILLN